MLLKLKDLTFPLVASLALTVSSIAHAELPSQDPADYNLTSAREAFQAANRAFEQRNDEIETIRSNIASHRKEVNKLKAQNKRLALGNPTHPTIVRNRAKILKLESEIPKLQSRLPKLEKAILPFRSDREAAQRRLTQVNHNVEAAEEHLFDLAVDFASVAHDFAYDRGRLEGEREGLRLGSESGRALGEEIGIYRAKLDAIAFGRQSGSQEGTSSGASEAVRLAYETGEYDAWEERGYQDGYDMAIDSPNTSSRTYSNAYQNGRQRAQNDAFALYLPGVEKANAYYRSQTLSNEPLQDLEYNPKARPWVSLAKQATTIPNLDLKRVPFESRKKPSLTFFNLPSDLQIPIVDEELPHPDIVIEFHPHVFEPRSVPFVRVPTQSLHNYFEREYLQQYEEVSRNEYEEAYARHFEESFHRSAEEQIRIYSNPSLYRRIADELERIAFDHYFENARADTFNRDYPNLYQQVREKAFRSPDINSPLYQDAYQDGEYNAHTKRGDSDGYSQNISSFQDAEQARGYSDRDDYFKNNAVIRDTRFTLEDDNRDGVFAINETFHLSIKLKNLGLTPQGAQQAKIRLHILEGPASSTVSEFTLPPLNPQGRISLDRKLSGLVERKALAKQTVKIKAELIEFGRIAHSQTFRFLVDYPLELSQVQHPSRLFSNQENQSYASLNNSTTQATPGDLELRLVDSRGRILVQDRLPSLQSRDSQTIDLNYLIDPQEEFTTQELTLELTSQDIVQLRHSFPRRFVSRRYATESGLLLFVQDHTSIDLKPLKDRLRAQGLGFDLYSLDQEAPAASRNLFAAYSDGYIVADLGRTPDSDTAKLLQDHYRNGGSLFVASPNFSRSSAWVRFLPQFGLKITDKPSTQTLKGQSILEGTYYRNQFTTNTRLTFQTPQKNVISYPLIRTDKRRGFGVATHHASRSLHPIDLNTFSLATFSLEELRPNEFAFLVSELASAEIGFAELMNRFAQSNSEKQASYRANLIKTRLLECHVLAAKLKDKAHKTSALANYQSRFQAFVDFAYQNADSSFLRPYLYNVANELSRKRHSSANRSELKSLIRILK